MPTSGEGSSRKKRLLTILTIVLSTMLCFVLTEFLLRVGHVYQTGFERNEGRYKSFYKSPYTSHYPVLPKTYRMSVTPEFSYPVSVNSLGFLGGEWPRIKAKWKRILVLGDSFTEGIGAPADSSWPFLLEKMLNSDSVFAEVFNAGVSGSDPVFQNRLFQHKLVSYLPEMVVMTINFSDIHEIITRGGEKRFRANGQVVFNSSPAWEPLYQWSYFFRFMIHTIFRYDFSLLSPQEYAIRSEEAVREIIHQAYSLHQFCKEKNTGFTVVIHPYLDPYDAFLRQQDILGKVDSGLRNQGVQIINLFSPFRDKVNKTNYKQYAWPVDKHYNSRGYAMFARFVADSLRPFLMLVPDEGK